MTLTITDELYAKLNSGSPLPYTNQTKGVHQEEQLHAPPYPCCAFLSLVCVGLNTQVEATEVYRVRETQLETYPERKKKQVY